MSTSEKEYKIDRKAASKLLKVSTRTVDRYAKSKKLSTRTINGRIFFNRSEIAALKNKKMSMDKVDMSTPDLSIDNDVDKLDNFEVIGQEFVYSDVESVNSRRSRRSGKIYEEEIYKKLYSDVKEELKEKQDRLEMANYRVGQLETQLKNSVPLLEYKKDRDEKIMLVQEEKNRLLSRLRYELTSKRIFLTILMIILALQPLWLLLVYK